MIWVLPGQRNPLLIERTFENNVFVLKKYYEQKKKAFSSNIRTGYDF